MSDTPLLLVHGFPLDARMWQRQVAYFEGKRAVLAPDLPGHGSDGGAALTSVDAIADALAAQLDRDGIAQVDLAGFSMGGYISFAFWRLHPDRVRSLALVDTKAPSDNEQQRQGRLDLTERVKAAGPGAARDAMLPKLLSESAPGEDRALTERMIMESRAETVVADLLALRERPDSVPTLATITVPSLVLVGADDAITPPSEAEAMAAGIPGAVLVVVPGAAHLAPLEKGDDVSRALEAHLAR